MTLRFSLQTLVSLFIVGLLSCMGYEEASAQSDDYGQSVIDAANRQIPGILNKFRPHVANEHRDLLSLERVSVVVAADFNAFADLKDRRVLIPAQLAVETLLQAQALGVIRRSPNLRQHWEPWMRQLTQRTADAHSRFKSGRSLVDDSLVKPFWAFAGLTAPPALDSRDQLVHEKLMHDSLALVIAHELGHLVLPHRPYSEISTSDATRQEIEADRFASTLMQKSNIDVLPGLTMVFVRFAMLEEIDRRPEREVTTHRRAICRFFRMGRNELRRAEKDPKFESYSLMSLAALRDAVGALEDRCTVQ